MESSPTWDADACIDDLINARMADMPPALQNPGAGLYLLVDPLLGDPVLPEPIEEGLTSEALNSRRSAAWDRAAFSLTLPAGMAMDMALAPYLVELRDASDPWLENTVQWALAETVRTWDATHPAPVAHKVGGWLQSPADGPTLASHLSAWLCVRTVRRTAARYLRLADRRVLSLATHVLGEVVMAASLPPIDHWHWLDAHGAWRTLIAPPTGRSNDLDQPGVQASAFPVFSACQWALMVAGPDAHHRMAQAISTRLNQIDSTVPSRWPPVSPAQWQAALAL